MAKLIAKTYGEALFELAAEEGYVNDILEETIGLIRIFDENPEYISLLTNPRISVKDKHETLEAVFSQRLSKGMLVFLKIIIQKGRSDSLKEILEYAVNRMKEHKGIGVAYVSTPQKLTQQMQDRIQERLAKTTSFKTMEMHYEIDPALIGGVRIRIGDRVVDSSIQTKLNHLQKELMSLRV